jgi:tetratricopeptide (TPR) repeat protein
MNREARVSPQVDLEHPWLGLESFSESTRAYFFGRDAETAELLQRLQLNPLLVLYGRSGLGKTSLLRARLVPDLKNLGFRPAFYRIRYRKGEDPSPLEQLLVALEALRPIDVPDCKLPDDPASRLWLHFHQRERKDRITHVILDQFEEIFTLGAQRPGASAELRQVLAILVQGAIPAPVESLLGDSEAFLKHFQLDVPPLRVLLSLRQDYVFALNRWRSQLPALGQNSFELGELGIDAAIAAVFKPGELRCRYRGEVKEENKADTGMPPIVTKETAERIVRFVARKREDLHIEDIEAVPPILSLLCQELNLRRFPQPTGAEGRPVAQITFGEGESGIETIIANFYERCLAGRPEAVRIFIEEKLVSGSGARLQHDEKSMLKVFAEGCEIPGAAEDRRAAGYGEDAKARVCLGDLVNQRLLISVGGGENPSYELIHDLLARVVQKSRTAREERFEKEQADLRAEAEKKAKDEAEARAQIERDRVAALDVALKKETDARQDADRARRRARWLAITAILVALVAAITSIVAFKARTEAEKQRGLAEEATKRVTAALEKTKHARDEAEQLIDFMVKDLHDKLESRDDMFLLEKIERRIEAHYESLIGEDQGPEMLRHWESVKLNNHGHQFEKNGDLPRALECFQKSLTIRKELAGHDLTNARWQRDLAESYSEIGQVFYDQGNLPNTLTYYQNSLDIARKLAKQGPNPDLQRLLMDCLKEIGELQRQQLDLKNALANSQEAFTIAEKLARQEPDNTDWQEELADASFYVGVVLLNDEKPDEALEKFLKAFDIYKRLTEQDPQNTVWRNSLATAYAEIGDALSAKQDMTESVQNYRVALVEQEKIAKQNPDNAKAQEQLALIISRVGDALNGRKDWAERAKTYRSSIAIFEKLTQRDSANAKWQLLLASFYTRLSDTLSSLGQFKEARKPGYDSVAIMEKLTEQDSTNADWQKELAISYVNLGDILSKIEPKSKEARRSKLEKGRDILLKLKGQPGWTAANQTWLDLAQNDLAEMVKKK